MITRHRRCQIFKDALSLIAALPQVRLLNSVFPKHLKARSFERLLNRINRNVESYSTRALLVVDQGSEAEYTRLYRRMRVYNPITSSQGHWADTSQRTKNIPIERIIEDPFFKDSAKSYFIQLLISVPMPCCGASTHCHLKPCMGLTLRSICLSQSWKHGHQQRIPKEFYALRKKAGPTSTSLDGFGPALSL